MLDHSETWRRKYEVFADIFCDDLPLESDGSKVWPISLHHFLHPFLFIIKILFHFNLFMKLFLVLQQRTYCGDGMPAGHQRLRRTQPHYISATLYWLVLFRRATQPLLRSKCHLFCYWYDAERERERERGKREGGGRREQVRRGREGCRES